MASDEVQIVFEEGDIQYEEDILRNPYSVKGWIRYIDYKKNAPRKILNMIYERAVKQLPGSYKLWYSYLRERRRQARNRLPGGSETEEANNAHERALVHMHKMPRIWLDYCQFLMWQGAVTRTRRAFNRSLRALPITQHERIWKLFLKFADNHADHLLESSLRVYRRYVKFSYEDSERLITFLLKYDQLDEAAIKLTQLLNDDDFQSSEGKTRHQMWHELCRLVSQNPGKVVSVKADAIIRQGIRRYTDQVGVLWNALAEHYIRAGNNDRARDIYEEAMSTVLTVRDFGQVFDAAAEFEESVVRSRLEETDAETDDTDLELGMARLEDLMDRRPLLLNSVLLRQNPHNVLEWHKRVKLYEGKPRDQIATYMEAVKTVDPKLATGRPHTLWVEFAKFYERHGQLADARVVFEKAAAVEYKTVDDLASVWCEWAEMEIRHENYEEALRLIARATALPKRKVDYYDRTETVQMRLHKSLKLWSLYADLEESFGTFKTTKAVYDHILDLRIATPQIVINYGMFLEEHQFFEEAFKAYEKGIALFKWPNVYDVWITYLEKFTKRYGGSKLERARDLFEQCIEHCPPDLCKSLFLLYAKLEEEHGLARRATTVYERACAKVQSQDKGEMFNIYIRRVADLYGVTHTRAIYQQAIEVLPEGDARDMCMRFADMERKLGEVDRARAIYSYCSQMCDPRSTESFWRVWKDFEVAHGNEDTLREMLRIKRSVQATYNTTVNFMTAQLSGTAQAEQAAAQVLAAPPADSMAAIEAGVRSAVEEAGRDKILFVRGETQEGPESKQQENPEAIDIDDNESESESEDEATTVQDIQLEKQIVPTEVFGGLKNDDDDDD